MRTRSTALALAALASVASLAAFQAADAQQSDFVWKKTLAAGKTIQIKGVNGNVTAMPASGNEVIVTASKRSRRSDPASVAVRVVEENGSYVVCAVYPTPRSSHRENECGFGEDGQMNVNNNDVRVDFTVQVPAGVHLDAGTVNGDVSAENLASDVDAQTVNGGVEISTRGAASASTVNGSIRARIGTATPREDLVFETVNGTVTLDVPAALNADVRFATLNGGIDSDFPVTMSGKFNRHRVTGRIGAGGATISAKTVNGGIRLRKGG